jgi:hypothetical protein
MNLEAAYLEAALPDPFRILGQDLEPYSLGHEMLLRRHGNSFVSGAKHDPGSVLQNLFMGVFVCSQRFEAACLSIRDPALPAQYRAWRRKLGKFDELEKIIAFQDYILAGSSLPEFKPIKRRGRPLPQGSPYLLCLLRTLLGPLHQSWSDAHNFPYGQARWLHASYLEREGNLYLTEESDEDLFSRITLEAAKFGLQPIKIERN